MPRPIFETGNRLPAATLNSAFADVTAPIAVLLSGNRVLTADEVQRPAVVLRYAPGSEAIASPTVTLPAGSACTIVNELTVSVNINRGTTVALAAGAAAFFYRL